MLEATKVIEISLFSRIQGRFSRFAEGCLGCIDRSLAPELVNLNGGIEKQTLFVVGEGSGRGSSVKVS